MCVQVNGRRVHIVGVVYLGYTRVVLLSVFFSLFCSWRWYEKRKGHWRFIVIHALWVYGRFLSFFVFFGSLYHSFLDIFFSFSLFPYTIPCIA